jgi:hypothetical protein
MSGSILPLTSWCDQERAAIDEFVMGQIEADPDTFFTALASLNDSDIASRLRSRPDHVLEWLARLAKLAMAESAVRVYDRARDDKQT